MNCPHCGLPTEPASPNRCLCPYMREARSPIIDRPGGPIFYDEEAEPTAVPATKEHANGR